MAGYRKQLRSNVLLLVALVVCVGILTPTLHAQADGLFDIGNIALNAVQDVILFGAYIVYSILGYLISFAGSLLGAVVSQPLIVPDVIIAAAKIFRDFINMFFILVLIIMAFGTIFDIAHYKFQDLFVKFLVAALLINFSLAIGGYIVDLSNGLSQVSLKTMQGGASTGGGVAGTFISGFQLGGISDIQIYKDGNPVVETDDNFRAFIFVLMYLLLLILVEAIAFFALAAAALFSLMRIPIIWLLLLVSPAAWFGYALPTLREQTWSKWWGSFINWSLFLPVYLFFLMFAVFFARQQSAIKLALPQNVLTAESFGGVLVSLVTSQELWMLLLTAGIMIGGIWAAFQIGGFAHSGAGALMNRIQGGLLSTSKTIAKYTPGAQRVQTYYEGVKQGFTARGEQFQKRGLPGPLSIFYRGKDRTDLRRAEVAEKWSFGALHGEKAKLEQKLLTEEKERLTEKIKVNETSTSKIREEVEKGGAPLRDFQGNLNVQSVAKYQTLMEKGVITKKQFDTVMTEAAPSPYVVSDLTKTASESNWRGMNEKELLEIVAPTNPLYASKDKPALKTVQKQLFQYMITDEGKKRFGDKLNYETISHGVSTVGGMDSNEGQRFLFELAKMRPELVTQYKVAQQQKIKRVDDGTYADGFGRIHADIGTALTPHQDALKSEHLNLMQGDSATDIANFDKATWDDAIFREALEQKMLNMEAANKGREAGDRYELGAGVRFRQDLESALRGAKNNEEKSRHMGGFMAMNRKLGEETTKARDFRKKLRVEEDRAIRSARPPGRGPTPRP